MENTNNNASAGASPVEPAEPMVLMVPLKYPCKWCGKTKCAGDCRASPQPSQALSVNVNLCEQCGKVLPNTGTYGHSCDAVYRPAQPSQAGELSDEQRWDIVTDWFSDEDMQSRALQMLGDYERAIAAINAKGA